MSKKMVACSIGKLCTLEARLEGKKTALGNAWRCHHHKPHKHRPSIGCDDRATAFKGRAMDDVCQPAKEDD